MRLKKALLGFFALVALLLPTQAYAELSTKELQAIYYNAVYYDNSLNGCAAGVDTQPVAGNALSSATLVGGIESTQIVPTGIVLHWTAYNYATPQDLISVMGSRHDPVNGTPYPNGRWVQLTVDESGKVYQLTKTLETRPMQTVNDQGWNDKTIGIEIESVTSPPASVDDVRNSIMNNSAQYQTVLSTVRELMTKYGIANEADTANKKGIFGHYEIMPGNPDPSAEYMAKIRADLTAVPATPPAATTPASFNPNCGCPALNGSNNEQIAFNYLRSKGLSNEQAAGVTGNLKLESGLDPTIVSDAGYHGIAQWDGAPGGRWSRLVTWADDKGRNPLDFATQLDYMWEEATARGNIEGLKQQTSVDMAAWHWGRYFEVAIIGGSSSEVPLTNVQHLDRRIEYAEQIFIDYSNGATGGSCEGVDGIDIFPLVISKAGIKAGAGGGIWCYRATNNCHHDYNAADIHAAIGTQVVAAAPGQVIRKRDSVGGAGSGLTIKGEDGRYLYYYTHMTYGSLSVNAGDTVAAGQVLGTVGDSAQAMGTAPHLHFDMLPLSEQSFRPNCSGAACSGYPFINVQPLLVELYNNQLPD